MKNSVLNSLKGRTIYSGIIKRMGKTSDVEWWIDHVAFHDGMRFDSSGDAWTGLRHLENIFYLRANRYGGYEAWNSSMCLKVYNEMKRKRDWYSSVIDQILRMF